MLLSTVLLQAAAGVGLSKVGAALGALFPCIIKIKRSYVIISAR